MVIEYYIFEVFYLFSLVNNYFVKFSEYFILLLMFSILCSNFLLNLVLVILFWLKDLVNINGFLKKMLTII